MSSSQYSVNQTSVFPNQRVVASETYGGITQMATAAQVAAGTRKDRAVSPYQLANAQLPFSNVAITGGTIAGVTINNSAIGGTTRAAGAFTTLGANGLSTLAGITAVGAISLNASGAGVTTIGTGGTGAVNIGNATGNTSITGSLTASTSLTATLGNITATNGNFVKGTAGNKDVYTSLATTTTAGANSAGTVTLAGGTATISTTAVTASSKIRLYRQDIGSTGAAAIGNLTVGTIVAGTSFVINSVSDADATALVATDVSVVFWEIVN